MTLNKRTHPFPSFMPHLAVSHLLLVFCCFSPPEDTLSSVGGSGIQQLRAGSLEGPSLGVWSGVIMDQMGDLG